MLKILLYQSLAMLLLLLTGCVKDDSYQDPDPDVNMAVNVSTRSTSSDDANSLGINEYRLQKMRIIVFNSDGSLDANFYDDALLPDAETYKSPYFPISKSNNKKVCVVVNEPVSATASLQAVTSYTALQAITYQLADYLPQKNLLDCEEGDPYFRPSDNSYSLPMYGELGGVNVPAKYNDVNMLDVYRCVARIDIYMANTDWSSVYVERNHSTVQFLHTAETGFYTPASLSGEDKNTTEMPILESSLPYYLYSKDTGDTLNIEDRIFSFYVPEKSVSSGKLIIKLNGIFIEETGECKSYQITVEPQGDNTKMERNRIYRIFCKVVGADLLITTAHVTSWNLAGNQSENLTADMKMTNCHIVAPGGRVSIPLDEVYKIWRDEFGETVSRTSTPQIEVLWETKDGLITDCDYQYSTTNGGSIRVETAGNVGEGNALIAVKVDGVIRWSWHIWVTTYEPNVAAGQEVTAAGEISMNRNLGYNSSTDFLQYQVIRKDPFRPVDITTTTALPGTIYKESAIASVKAPTACYGNRWEDAYWGSNTNVAPGTNYWWKSDNRKGIFDPCPDGWKVKSPIDLPTGASRPYVYTLRCIKEK